MPPIPFSRLLLVLVSLLIAEAGAGAANPTVAGTQAVLKNGLAHAPAEAPEAVKKAIWAVNAIVRKPYRWGGGHASFVDRGYDCSGTVSYLLHHAGLLERPLASKEMLGWGEAGVGRWITVYTRSGHAFAMVAGLRLDTTGASEREGPRWHEQPRELGGFAARRMRGW